MTNEELFKLVEELKEAKNIIVESDIKRRILHMLVDEFDLIYVAKQSYENIENGLMVSRLKSLKKKLKS